jgi:DNA gyrase subunit B/topoisomerase-4 subunit B
MRYSNKPAKLEDCRDHGPGSGAELFLVEGDSAAHSVAALRNKQFQAVLPMQGKPMNAAKASESRIQGYGLFSAFRSAMGMGAGEPGETGSLIHRFEKIVLLFDPDADGIHSGALMLIFLHRVLPELLDNGAILMVRAPLYRVTSPALNQPQYAASEFQIEELRKKLSERGITDQQTLRYRGLGSLEHDLLLSRCIDPTTRKADVMTRKDAKMALQVFGGIPANVD